MTSGESQRWHGQRSSFTWEQDALDFVKAKLPSAEPYRAWQTFTFTGPHGHVREVDLLLAAPGGLFLVEIKSHPGTAANNGSTWLFRDGTAVRTIENPLHFTDQKAKELRTQLQRAADQLPGPPVVIPRVEAAVFLSAENLRCEFDEFQRQRVYGRDGLTGQTKLPGIWKDFLNQPPASERRRITPALSRKLPELLRRIGSRLHQGKRVGPYELQARSFDAGPTWEDYLAANPSLPKDQPRRVRVYLSEQTATEEEKASTRRAAHREYLAIQGISHEGIVRAEQYSDELLAGPAVIFRHGERWRRLDHFIAAEGEGLAIETRLDMIRQVGEALDHAHRRHLYHRALAPRSVYVELDGNYPRLRIADWQVASRPHPATTPSTPSSRLSTPAALLRHVERSAGPYLAPEFTSPGALAELLDVFGLGAISYLILTGQAPAADREELARKLTSDSEHALVPSSVADSISPDLDTLVRRATARHHAERTRSIRDFLRVLDRIEQALAEPDEAADADPLTAGIGDFIQGWEVKRVLGKGSTSRALLVTRDNSQRVFKVALNEAAARRLCREAEELSRLNDSHVARLLDEPFPFGPPGHERTLIGVEYVGDHTLAEELRRTGPAAMSLYELEHLGDDLFQAVDFLHKRQVWHRDIKPENLALRKLPRKDRELVLFDFSAAGAPDTDLEVGTRDYIDPFLGPPRRTRYDHAAELYAVAVTLHEMVSGELPSWGDGITPAGFLGEDEQVQLAADVFDPVIRDGLVAFFRKAFQREAADRFGSPYEMRQAWSKIFADVASAPPLSTPSTDDAVDDTDERTWEEIQAMRDEAAARATRETGLVAAGLSPHAQSAAHRYLDAETAGDLAEVPAHRIRALKGIGRDPQLELIRRSMQWRERFDVSETSLPQPDIQTSDSERIMGSAPDQSLQEPPGKRADADDEALARLPLDEVARRLVPAAPPVLRQITGQAAYAPGRYVGVWTDRAEVARDLRMSVAEVAAHLDRMRARWAKSVRELKSVRDDVVGIVRAHGRVQDAGQLASALLTARGADLDAPAERLRVAAVCVRAAIETEERLERPRLLTRRLGSSVIVTLTGEGEDGDTPRAEDLFAYAELLSEEAARLAARDPLASAAEVRKALREVDTPDHSARLSDTDLVQLAAAASQNAAVNTRFELYPRDMDKLRALRLSQAGSLLNTANSAGFVRRVLLRFPDLTDPPEPGEIPGLLAEMGWKTAPLGDEGDVLHLRSSTVSLTRQWERQSTSVTSRAANLAYVHERLAEARRLGGFVAVKTRVERGTALCGYLAGLEGVAAVDVGALFVRLLREVVAEQGRPRWDVVLAADSDSASPAARTGFAALLAKTWERLAAQIRAIGDNGCIVLLHDATPLARYSGGLDVLAKLAVAARDSEESPFGLWLLCPMPDPQGLPLLDGQTVGVIPGDAEQLYVPDDFARKDSKAS